MLTTCSACQRTIPAHGSCPHCLSRPVQSPAAASSGAEGPPRA